MNSIDWLIEELYNKMNMSGDGRVLDEILEEARHKHKQEMGDTWDAAIFRNAQRGYNASRTFEDFDDYYQETFVSKGSDDIPMERKLLKSGFVDIVPKEENHIVDINEMVEDDVEKLAEEEYPTGRFENLESYDDRNRLRQQGFIKGWNKCKETLYTEEQVNQKMIDFANWCRMNDNKEFIIEQLFYTYQSLKQPKKN